VPLIDKSDKGDRRQPDLEEANAARKLLFQQIIVRADDIL
jgi:hypothetical protein